MFSQSRVVWVFDAGAGHLAIAHRAGVLRQLLNGPTEHLRDIKAALDALDRGTIPAGIIFAGGPAVENAAGLLADSRLEGTSVLFAYSERQYVDRGMHLDSSIRERVYFAPESIDLRDGLSWFAETILGRAKGRY